MLSSGKNLPSNYRNFDLTVPLPEREDDFEFGSTLPRNPCYLENDHVATNLPDTLGGADDHLGLENAQRILVCGFHIWAQVSSWICGGGRRTQTPSSACAPWRQESHWNGIYRSLRHWRSRLSPRLLYSPDDSNLRAHVSRGNGETFAIINLLYDINVVFLHRDYIPFLAHRVRRPTGPVDPPLILDTPPDGWWEHGARDMFQAAKRTVQLMQGLDENGIGIDSPFTCFCIYIAGTVLSYLEAWPHMAPEVTDAPQYTPWTLTFLEVHAQRWPICDGWKKTLMSLGSLYRHINAGGQMYSQFGRDDFIQVEDRLHRFAAAKPPRNNEIVEPLQGSPASLSNTTIPQSRTMDISQEEPHTNISEEPNGLTSTYQDHGAFESTQGAWEHDLQWYYDSQSDLTASQDIMTSILGTQHLEGWLLDI